ncbi:MAG: YkgJ family cysteine cluster protein [Thermodesulfobacteriota bacterium]|nr:YkgJ family cysteine cluster protein [Thermodesulfobacteriota bacterium]
MNFANKLVALDRIYQIYDHFTKGLDLACKRYCADCCTRNVTLTTLEGYKIADFLKQRGKTDLYANIKTVLYKKRFSPEMTMNMLAELCRQGKDIPQEEIDVRWGECPLLTNNECPIYPVRPFGCRCFVSGTRCGETGYAEVDPFVLTVNSLFLQYIEHVDRDGYFGNLSDVLLFMRTDENGKLLEKGNLNYQQTRMIPNRPMKALFVPPEHKARIKPILSALKNRTAYLGL